MKIRAPWFACLYVLAACSEVGGQGAKWPTRNAGAADAGVREPIGIERQAVCVGSRSWSAGQLGDTLLYRSRRNGNTLEVGYFVYWSTERPWGANVGSFTLLPALATDAFYSHFLYVFPGVKDALYGPADIEGVSVDYEERVDGSLSVIGGRADDGNHRPVLLSRDDLLDSRGRVVLLTEVWSHQLGAHGGGRFADAADNEVTCYGEGTVRPMTVEIARAYRLGSEQEPRRAKAAWGERAPRVLTASGK
ncbi:MAG TPA: hypothetical protein VF395_20015 [Polyangiaceae bacterium]